VEDDEAPTLRISWPIFFLLIRDPVQDPEPVEPLLTGGRPVARDPSCTQPLPPPPGPPNRRLDRRGAGGGGAFCTQPRAAPAGPPGAGSTYPCPDPHNPVAALSACAAC